MAKLSSNFGVFILAVGLITSFNQGHCTENSIFQTKFQIPKSFGQNLTEEIDTVLNEKNSIHKAVLKEALQWSHIVYYESDILLNEIESIIPVIDLLDQLKTEESPPIRITLSLPYFNKTNGKFLLHRMGDMYYSLNTSITASNRTKLLKSVASLTLNFVSPYPDYNSFIYGNDRKDFQFVNYVKNFVSFYFGHLAIPVGIMWNGNVQFYYIYSSQTSEADFLIYYAEYDINQRFPVFMEQLDAAMKSLTTYVETKTTLFIKGHGEIEQDEDNLWHLDNLSDELVGALYKTPNYQNISEKFVSKICQKSSQLFDYIVLSWANMRSYDVILGTAMQNISTEILLGSSYRFKLIMPVIQMEEVTIDVCTLGKNMSKWRNNYEVILLDEMSWRALARFKNDLAKCNDENLNSSLTKPEDLKVMVELTNGIAHQWNILDPYINSLFMSNPKISGMVLDTIIFYDGDVKNSLEIQQFIKLIKQTHKIGCSIQYESMFDAVSKFVGYDYKYLEDTFKNSLEGNLCSPMFELLDVMIWYVPRHEDDASRYFKDKAFSAYSNVFLLREVFQGVFPQISVYIKFASELDKRIIANLFNASILVPSDQILY